MPIYTRTGDTGETSLFGGKRVHKSHGLVEAYGSIDELNSWIGVIITQLEHSERKAFLQKVQSDLLTIGAYLAGWKEADLGMLGARVTEMELEIDVMGKELPELRNFILPGGILVAAQTQVCRSVCRRAERLVVAVSKKQRIDAAILQYLNRLSDLFFQLARFINYKAQVSDEVWLGIPRK